jgi:signal transduction histidine kinase
VRSIAYYTVGELLTNVVKHARATGAYVMVDRSDAGTLHLRVRDDGRGGAVVAPGVPGVSGTGLAGLAERVATVDGTFSLSSPAGGPTVVDVFLPTSTRP